MDILFDSNVYISALVYKGTPEEALACAIAGSADYLVTGDKDLLILKRYKHIRIITPKQFVDRL